MKNITKFSQGNCNVSYLIVHEIAVTHVIACASASLNVSPHVELDILAAHAPGVTHHRVAHAVVTGAIHPRITLVQITPARVVVAESTRAPRVRGVIDARLGPLVVTEP